MSVATAFHNRYPNVTSHLTERSTYDLSGNGYGPGIDRIVQYFRNWMSSWDYWLTFLDDHGQPYVSPTNGACCPMQIMATHGNLDNWWITRDYYLYGQFSRYIQRGAVRIASDYGSPSTVTNVAFKNPDGTIVVVAVNQTSSAQPLKLDSPDGQVTDTIPAQTVATYTWTSTTGAVYTRTGWTASASSTETNGSPANALDSNVDTRWSNGKAQAPGQSYTVDMGSSHTFDQVSLDSGTSVGDYSHGYALYVSADGTNWGSPVATGAGTDRITNVTFSPVTARYVRVVQTGTAPNNWWSIHEFLVFNSRMGLLPASGWTASASSTAGPNDQPNNALDGTTTTRWSSGQAQANGQWFQVDKVDLDAGPSVGDYARGYSLYVSNDGAHLGDAGSQWKRAGAGYPDQLPGSDGAVYSSGTDRDSPQ